MAYYNTKQTTLSYGRHVSEEEALRDAAAPENIPTEKVYNMEDGSGKIIVDEDYDHCEENAAIANSLHHANYLPPKFLHTAEGERAHRVFDYFESDMKAYVEASGKLMDPLTRQGLGEQFDYHYVHPILKVFTRSMLSFVRYMFKKSFVLTEKIFVVVEGVLKFWKLSFEKTISKTRMRNDYRSLQRVIKSSLFNWKSLVERNFPTFGNLFVVMLRPVYFPMVENHLAVLLPLDRVAFMKSAWENFKRLAWENFKRLIVDDKEKLNRAFVNMNQRNYLEWVKEFLGPESRHMNN